jgi:hypothetical protein
MKASRERELFVEQEIGQHRREVAEQRKGSTRDVDVG